MGPYSHIILKISTFEAAFSFASVMHDYQVKVTTSLSTADIPEDTVIRLIDVYENDSVTAIKDRIRAYVHKDTKITLHINPHSQFGGIQ